MKFSRTGCIGRFKPLHNGGALMLKYMCKHSDHVIIGIGSSNKYNLRNPFTCLESKEMIDSYLKKNFSNYEFVYIPDFAHIPEHSDGEKWKEYVFEKFGKLTYFVSGNEYVNKLLKEDYKILHPTNLIPTNERVLLKGTAVRFEMAKGDNWKNLVPSSVFEYITENKIDVRFRKQFGLLTLKSLQNSTSLRIPENCLLEYMHCRER